jgi:acetyl esterase/lipase
MADYGTPEAEARIGVLETGCLNEITAAYVGLSPLVDVDPFADPDLVNLLVANEPGHAGSPVPVLVVQGGKDFIVLPAYTREYVQRACAAGTRVKLSEYADADHGTILGAAATEARQWIATVAAGQAPPTSC